MVALMLTTAAFMYPLFMVQKARNGTYAEYLLNSLQIILNDIYHQSRLRSSRKVIRYQSYRAIL